MSTNARLAPQFAADRAAAVGNLRINGRLGLAVNPKPNDWQLFVESDRGPA